MTGAGYALHVSYALLILAIVCGTTQPSNAASTTASRVGVLVPFRSSVSQEYVQYLKTFGQVLREHGYVEGQNIATLYRYSEGDDSLLPRLAKELVDLKVDVLVTLGTPATRAAQEATVTIPIVFVTVLDPVAAGFVASLARPGGNITGSSELGELSGKRLELLKAAAPHASRVAVLWDPTHPTNALDLKRNEEVAALLGVTLQPVSGHDAEDVERAFAKMRAGRAQAVVVLVAPAFFTNMKRIVALSVRNRLPAIWGLREGPEAGALMSYGPVISDQWLRAAPYVAKILNGAKPGELPVEQPTRFELVVNLRAAKALGLTIPQAVLAWADRVIR